MNKKLKKIHKKLEKLDCFPGDIVYLKGVPRWKKLGDDTWLEINTEQKREQKVNIL